MDISSLFQFYQTPEKQPQNPYEELIRDLELQVLDSHFFLKEKAFPMENPERLKELFPFSGLLDIKGRLLDIYPEQILFLDFETLGLKSTSMNFPIVTGLGFYKEGNFHLRQYLLFNMSSEEELLEILLDYFSRFPFLATYNGKKFDMPFLESRFRFYQKEFSKDLHHFDVYHLWKRLLPKNFPDGFSQKNLERKILNYHRKDDIESKRIPEIFYDFLKYQHHEEFPKVLQHNEWDVVNLFFLFVEALDLMKNKDQNLNLPIAKLLFRNQLYEEVISFLKNYQPHDSEEEKLYHRLLFNSFYKIRNYEQAAESLKNLITIDPKPKEIMIMIRILEKKLFRNQEAAKYIELLLQYQQANPNEKFIINREKLEKRKEKNKTYLL
ncbi:MAG: ribonuclease H-like domain-containing protein [Leptospiraceae bacterium]|nr:ribonuclease H-like domain-containing protein [Leptospiraceae bacterium]MDW7976085.1 ribonuclease H-like domain-containing protein [Leptospiraceae bacterium]